MNVNRTTIFAALLAAGIATGAIAQSTSPGYGTGSGKSSATAGSQPAPTTSAPPSAGSTGMDKGAGTGAAPADKAASSMSKGATAASSLSAGERRFIEKVGQNGKAGVEISKLALEKAENPQVKELAKQLIEGHTKANAELMKLASAKGVTIPAEMDRSHKRLLDKLAKKSGNAFDREYTDEMEDDHSKEVREFRSMSKSAKDPEVKAFAASTLPTLEQHLQMAKTAESAVKSAGRDRKTTTAGTGASTMAGSASTGAGPSGTAKSTATPGKDTAATTGTAGPGTGMPASSTQSTGTAPQPPGSASDTKTTAPTK
jgi:putative membrane protein